MVIWAYMSHPQPLFLVVRQVTSGHGSISPAQYLQADCTVFITVSGAHVKGELGEQAVHIAHPASR